MKLFSAFVVVAILSTVVAVSPLHADPRTGSLIDRSRNKMTGFHDPLRQRTARAAINTIARCKAENNRFRAAKTLDHRYLSEEQTESLNIIYRRVDYDEDNCYFNKEIKYGFSTAPIVGAFSEFFLTRNFDQADVDAIGDLTDSDWQQAVMKPRNASELFGRCMTRSSRDKVYNLVKTIPDTDAESAAIKSLIPDLGPCVTDGLEVSFDKTSLRALLAYGLYRAVHQHHEMLEAAE